MKIYETFWNIPEGHVSILTEFNNGCSLKQLNETVGILNETQLSTLTYQLLIKFKQIKDFHNTKHKLIQDLIIEEGSIIIDQEGNIKVNLFFENMNFNYYQLNYNKEVNSLTKIIEIYNKFQFDSESNKKRKQQFKIKQNNFLHQENPLQETETKQEEPFAHFSLGILLLKLMAPFLNNQFFEKLLSEFVLINFNEQRIKAKHSQLSVRNQYTFSFKFTPKVSPSSRQHKTKRIIQSPTNQQSKENFCCILHSLYYLEKTQHLWSRKKPQILLDNNFKTQFDCLMKIVSNLSPNFKYFLCHCLKYDSANQLTIEELLTHDFLKKMKLPIITFKDLVKTYFKLQAQTRTSSTPSEKLAKICELLNIILPTCEQWFKAPKSYLNLLDINEATPVIQEISKEYEISPRIVCQEVTKNLKTLKFSKKFKLKVVQPRQQTEQLGF